MAIAESGQAVGDGLGDADDVRDDAGVLERPHPTGSAVAGLDLVGDEQDAVLVAALAKARGGMPPARACSPPSPWTGSTKIAATVEAGAMTVSERANQLRERGR